MIDVNPNQLKTVTRILAGHLPEYEVRAFGSRVTWTAKDYSDLDLVVVGQRALDLDALSRLKEAFEESDLPFRVDVLDWHAIGPSFQKVIEKKYEIVQKSKKKSMSMASEWRSATVTDLQNDGILLVEDGNHGEYRPRPDEFVDRGVAFIRAADMEAGRVLFQSASKISELARKRITKGIGAPGDVLLSHKGTVGKVALVLDDAPPFVCSPQTTFWRTCDQDRLDRKFLYAFLRSKGFHAQLATRSGETDMAPYVSLTSQRGLSVTLPPIETQRAIANILSTLDDKIELNRQMNETLEAMTRALFKSWFVDFDPVRAKAKGRDSGLPKPLADLFPDSFEDSELGEIPKGWWVGTLGDVAEHPRRGLQPTEIEPSTPYIALEHMPRRSIALSEWGAAEGLESNKFEFKRGEILFGKLRPYFHKVGVAPVCGVCSTDIVVVAPRERAWFGFVLGHMSSDAFVEHTNAGSTGTKMPRTSWTEMARYPVVVPQKKVCEAYTNQIRPSSDGIVASIHESRTLAAMRDMLLPRFISGELHAMNWGDYSHGE